MSYMSMLLFTGEISRIWPACNDEPRGGDRIEMFPVPNDPSQRHHLADHRQTP